MTDRELLEMREEFEAWAVSKGYARGCMISGHYIHADTSAAWNAWQASRAAPTVQGESVATVTEEVFGSDGTSDFISAQLPVGTKLYTAPQPAPSTEQVERWRHDSEDLEALHNNLDDAGTPRHDSSGVEYSERGRVIQYAKAAAQAEAAELAGALERCMTSMLDAGFNTRSAVMAQGWQALAAYRKQGGES